jgi:hypothetical protein
MPSRSKNIGVYKPFYPEKYRGDPNNIVYRSLWELRVMMYLDKNANVINWGSEEIIIPYLSPIDMKMHRYFPDFYAEVKGPDGIVRHIIMEVKPHSETVPPVQRKRTTKKYLTEMVTYAVNDAKFHAAREFCDKLGWEFKVITEKELF